MSSLVTILPICSYIERKGCTEDSLAHTILAVSTLLKWQQYLLEDSGSAENKEELLFSHDKLLLASILRPLHQVTKEMLV